MACLTPPTFMTFTTLPLSPFFSFCPYLCCSSKLSKSWLHHQNHWYKFKARVFSNNRFLRYRIPFFLRHFRRLWNGDSIDSSRTKEE
ncbi:hypothetical protein L6164_010990 [Bauhinia variegata]|uniref:Uncharacterized protein n=1 Tax=Bauhinia variegata TaxID=167791 RepID=A0ACB9P6T9_BAUVA|nr:hypothetical protein L6164_010990 [Bauhinia variegata]